jgi:hypothetical protein
MRAPKTHLLVSILLLTFSDSWLQAQTDATAQTGATPAATAAGVAEAPKKEIDSVLKLFRGEESDWPLQHGDRWCWAASAEIIMSSHGRTSWKQCIQADDAYPGKSWPSTCCDDPVGASPLCNRTGWPHFEYYGFHSLFTNKPLDWEQLKDQIEQGQPVAVAVKYLNPAFPGISRGGHMGVIAGYAVLSDKEQAVLIVDPDGFHGGMWALYDEVFGDSSEFSRHWRTYYDIRPLR